MVYIIIGMQPYKTGVFFNFSRQFHRCVLSEWSNFRHLFCMFSSTRMGTMGCVWLDREKIQSNTSCRPLYEDT